MRLKFPTKRNEEGALLLIALVILGVITLATVYLSLVLLSEIRSARYTDNGITSHYVAESGIERALWNLKLAKENGTPNTFTGLNALTQQCAAEDDGSGACEDPERIFDYTKAVIAAGDFTVYDVPQNTPVSADIYDPAQDGVVGGQTAITQFTVNWSVVACSGSARLETTYTPVSIVTAGAVPQAGQTVTQVNVCGCGVQGTYGYACTPNFTIPVSTSNFYRISFRSLDAPIKKLTMTANAEIPSQVEIKTTSTYRESQSSITARTMWKDVLSGIFGFVIFSEESLIKDTKSDTGTVFGSLCGFCSGAVATPCSSDADCSAPALCSIANTAADAVDGATTQAFCSEVNLPTEIYSDGAQILQTNDRSCNMLCNGYTFCGDGALQTPNGYGDGANGGNEECDLGAGNSNTVADACRKDCRNPRCGDGVKDTKLWELAYIEECDDDNGSNADTCYQSGHASACRLTTCGDGIVQNPNGAGTQEQCDAGGSNGSCPGGCSTSCTPC